MRLSKQSSSTAFGKSSSTKLDMTPTKRASGNPRRKERSVGVAMQASPSQFGMMTAIVGVLLFGRVESEDNVAPGEESIPMRYVSTQLEKPFSGWLSLGSLKDETA